MARRNPFNRRRGADPEPFAPTSDPAHDPATAAYPVVLPAGLAEDDVEVQSVGFKDRGRLRRRLRYLRRVRELGFRDLGGLTFDLHRFGRQGEHLVQGKLAALGAVDQELRALERALDDEQDFMDLREPGIASCPRCAALHGTDAHFCPNCGLRLGGPTAVGEVGDAPAAASPVAGGPLQGTPPPAHREHNAGGVLPTPAGVAGGRPTDDALPADGPDATAAAADEQPTVVERVRDRLPLTKRRPEEDLAASGPTATANGQAADPERTDLRPADPASAPPDDLPAR